VTLGLSLGIVVGYLLFALAVGLVAYRVSEATAEDYYLANRSIGTVVLLFTTFGPDTLGELRQSWAAANDWPHVHDFDDMHHIGDELVQAGFSDPVMDVETLTVTYPDVRSLMRDLKASGARNARTDRARGLTGRRGFQSMLERYEQHRTNGVIPATLEVVYGHALAPKEGQPRRTEGGQEASFSVDSLRSTIRRTDR
jgi:malonyl-CoA O-methyltransferase